MRRHHIALFLLVCYLGIYNGNLALFDGGSPTPLEIFPYKAALYPEADQAALQDGIPCKDPRELSRILEDFLS